MEARTKSMVRNSIISILFKKEQASIQDKIDDLISRMNVTMPGNWYWYKEIMFSKQNGGNSLQPPLNVIVNFAPEMEEIYILNKEASYNKVVLTSYIVNVLNACELTSDCFLMFPTCITNELNKEYRVNFSDHILTEKLKIFLIKNKAKSIAITEQYTKSVLL